MKRNAKRELVNNGKVNKRLKVRCKKRCRMNQEVRGQKRCVKKTEDGRRQTEEKNVTVP
jgi:hypothetical protein